MKNPNYYDTDHHTCLNEIYEAQAGWLLGALGSRRNSTGLQMQLIVSKPRTLLK